MLSLVCMKVPVMVDFSGLSLQLLAILERACIQGAGPLLEPASYIVTMHRHCSRDKQDVWRNEI